MQEHPNDLQPDTEAQQSSMRVSRIILPVLIGVGVVAYLFWRQFDAEEFARIDWTGRLAFWLGVAVALAAVRHLAYAARLRVLSNGAFSWWKCMQLIFLWEFSSAVSPTSLGGSAVAFFLLSREKLSLAKTTTIVLYTVVLDSAFMLLTLPFLYMAFGPGIMRPGATTFADAGAWGNFFIIAYLGMTAYTGLFFYGLFIGPHRVKRFLGALTSWRLLKRFRRRAIILSNEFILASGELRNEPSSFHIKSLVHTFVAWTTRFFLLSAIIVAFIPSIPVDVVTQMELYARLQTMFFVIAFSPTPGGAGLIELLFGGFLTDYVSSGTVSTIISSVWRLISYYVYLLAGAVLIPGWLRKTASKSA